MMSHDRPLVGVAAMPEFSKEGASQRLSEIAESHFAAPGNEFSSFDDFGALIVRGAGVDFVRERIGEMMTVGGLDPNVRTLEFGYYSSFALDENLVATDSPFHTDITYASNKEWHGVVTGITVLEGSASIAVALRSFFQNRRERAYPLNGPDYHTDQNFAEALELAGAFIAHADRNDEVEWPFQGEIPHNTYIGHLAPGDSAFIDHSQLHAVVGRGMRRSKSVFPKMPL